MHREFEKNRLAVQKPRRSRLDRMPDAWRTRRRSIWHCESNWRHGGRSGEAVALRKMVNALGREARKLAGAVPPKSTTTALAALERQGETEQSSHEDLLNSTREG